jgi:hypothetical protein
MMNSSVKGKKQRKILLQHSTQFTNGSQAMVTHLEALAVAEGKRRRAQAHEVADMMA